LGALVAVEIDNELFQTILGIIMMIGIVVTMLFKPKNSGTVNDSDNPINFRIPLAGQIPKLHAAF
jgi:uncharacterized membrane protein YfcA